MFFLESGIFLRSTTNSNFFGVLNFPDGVSCTSTNITFGIKSPIIEAFDISKIQKGAARFDEAKMAHINFQYLKALPLETYAWFARPVLTAENLIPDDFDESLLQKILGLCQEKITSL